MSRDTLLNQIWSSIRVAANMSIIFFGNPTININKPTTWRPFLPPIDGDCGDGWGWFINVYHWVHNKHVGADPHVRRHLNNIRFKVLAF